MLGRFLKSLLKNKMKQPAMSDSNVDNREGIKLKKVLLLLLHLLLLNFVKTMMHLVILCCLMMFVLSMLLCLVCILLSLTFSRRLMMGRSQG
jgi:hypothetical protein